MKFTLFSDPPTHGCLAAIAAAGITVRGWHHPNHYFNKRKSNRNTLRTERGWIDPHNVPVGLSQARYRWRYAHGLERRADAR